ncbi:hypothetical protein Axi01nite_81950 [Actinoplanes xinjiangensis]|nr:hypothetical protein Axi01nite_81950 [Actinoplanes xinjiangensis]
MIRLTSAVAVAGIRQPAAPDMERCTRSTGLQVDSQRADEWGFVVDDQEAGHARFRTGRVRIMVRPPPGV